MKKINFCKDIQLGKELKKKKKMIDSINESSINLSKNVISTNLQHNSMPVTHPASRHTSISTSCHPSFPLPRHPIPLSTIPLPRPSTPRYSTSRHTTPHVNNSTPPLPVINRPKTPNRPLVSSIDTKPLFRPEQSGPYPPKIYL